MTKQNGAHAFIPGSLIGCMTYVY